MLDNLLNTVKRGAEKVQRRGEEVAQVARLRMEVFQLGRDLDGHYARLGRSYHAGADLDLLQGIRDDIRRVEDDIRSRERLIEELGGSPDEPEKLASEITPVTAAQPAAVSVPPTPVTDQTPGAPSSNQSNATNAPNFVGETDKPQG